MKQIQRSYETFNVNESTVRDYLRVIFSHKVLIAFTIITVVFISYISLELKTPTYEANVNMLISAEKQVESPYYRELDSRLAMAEIVLTQTSIVKSRQVLERAAKVLSVSVEPLAYEKKFAAPLKQYFLDLEVKKFRKRLEGLPVRHKQAILFEKVVAELRDSIKVEPINDTNIFKIIATDFDPIEAAHKANIVGRSYVIFDLEQQLAELELKYGERHPNVIQLGNTINSLIDNLRTNPLSNIDAIGPATVKIIELASVPNSPKGPSKQITLIFSFVLGVILAFILTFLFEGLDQTFRSPKDIKKILNYPFLGSVPKRKLGEKAIVNGAIPNSLYMRHLQQLFANLISKIEENNAKKILITSTGDYNHSSPILANIGLYLSRKAKGKVLIIDANIKHSTLLKYLKIKRKGWSYKVKGWFEVLKEKASVSESILEVTEHLDILLTGKIGREAHHMIDIEKFVSGILDKVKENYDFIIVDCPNLYHFQDGERLTHYVDGTLVVLNEGQSRRQSVISAVNQIEQQQSRILGIILGNRTFPIPEVIYSMT
ncbi:MAG: hypothetical protein H6755_07490 [Candidatus Omnitrophica bacterium]|nr:hypothetical protein [Candidatus Omnitrophota bacterium]MCB9748235.1 hypothetical protein [Candidatus Omnitrophota bacterium]